MDFGIIYQLKTRKFWWLDVIFYFTAALLLAAVICFIIFSIKISSQEKKLGEVQNQITTSTGTAQQREEEKKVFEYQKRIDDFATILATHKTPTNVLKFFEETTLPNVWFSNFLMGAQVAGIQVSGEAESATALSRQMSIFEQNQLIQNVTNLNSETTETGRIRFGLNLALDPSIFFLTTLEEMQPGEILETTSPSSSLLLNRNIF